MTQPPPQRSTNDPAAAAPARRALIGTYVLETLTTGMYGEPRHTIREYVQNSYDAIRRARRNGWLGPDEGTITVTVDDGARTLSVRDDGTGITSGAAWATLSSVGASTKDRSNNAGFRGIGRLAGLAYCKRLLFVTKFGDEDVETTVTFDCDELRKGMDPKRGGGEDIQDLLSRAVTDQVRLVTEEERSLHYTEVVLEDTSLAPPE